MKRSFIAFSVVVVVVCGWFTELGLCSEEDNLIKMKLGGVHDCKGSQNSAEIESLARFAVQEHNKKQVFFFFFFSLLNFINLVLFSKSQLGFAISLNSLLEFARVLKAKEQVVAGTLYHLTLEAVDAGKKKIYEAKVWVKPWMNFKQLQEFKHTEDGPSFTPSDLGVKRDGFGLECRAVPTNDLEILSAANHVLNSIQQKSNSLFPYELLEILQAKAKVLEDYAKFILHLKLRRGSKEEKFWVRKVYFELNGKLLHLNLAIM
ncbi:hypothetical protein EZV62_005165 [Acer yangbiense]|uniref:Cysteine proteinase inhibitor n=1 Tax=Acer yangbiense TaxID=1000413 RepID=A0A5C7IM38_9ROSI|nr:hypothetical protein EZV62_005165 [Acer yangbiense]